MAALPLTVRSPSTSSQPSWAFRIGASRLIRPFRSLRFSPMLWSWPNRVERELNQLWVSPTCRLRFRAPAGRENSGPVARASALAVSVREWARLRSKAPVRDASIGAKGLNVGSSAFSRCCRLDASTPASVRVWLSAWS